MRQRIRTVKPELWKDERMVKLSHSARLLFVGFITMADDEGRFRARTTEIIGHIFPVDEPSSEQVRGWVQEIRRTGRVVMWKTDGEPYGAIRWWAKHQRINRPSPSELPPPPDDGCRRDNAIVMTEKGYRQAWTVFGGPVPPDFLTEDSVNAHGLITDVSMIIQSPRGSDPILKGKTLGTARQSDARALFDLWRERCGHPDALPTSERIAAVLARLKQGYTVQQIEQAIEGAARAAYVDGSGKRFDDLELICRNGSKVEDFMGRAKLRSISGGAGQSSAASYVAALNARNQGAA